MLMIDRQQVDQMARKREELARRVQQKAVAACEGEAAGSLAIPNEEKKQTDAAPPNNIPSTRSAELRRQHAVGLRAASVKADADDSSIETAPISARVSRRGFCIDANGRHVPILESGLFTPRQSKARPAASQEACLS